MKKELYEKNFRSAWEIKQGDYISDAKNEKRYTKSILNKKYKKKLYFILFYLLGLSIIAVFLSLISKL